MQPKIKMSATEWFDAERHNVSTNSLATVTYQMAANILNVSMITIENMVNRGELQKIVVDKFRFVRFYDLVKIFDQKDGDKGAVKRFLEARAKGGCRALYYSDAMAVIGLHSTKPTVDRNRMSAILDRISTETYKKDKILLSVIVHRKPNAGSRQPSMPSTGFWGCIGNLGIDVPDEEDRAEFVRIETQKVLDHYAG